MRASVSTRRWLERFVYREPEHRVDNLIVGAGVIGLSVGARLRSQRPSESTVIVERNAMVCQGRKLNVGGALGAD